ncbi:MAG: class I SAM-dependent methyltransferase [Bacteroidetes bacterium]|nr:class I SAM-dependent methyltransferase [Bacteroidota bacterium]
MANKEHDYKNLWDNRYREKEYAYGKEPNEFFKEQLGEFKPGSILMPADGEGRNGVYAAQLGWQVTSTDLSAEGREKALQLARERGVTIEYFVGDLEQVDLKENSFDAIGLIYAHFLAEKKSAIHKKLGMYLKPGGIIIFEAFSKRHIELARVNPRVGGPKDIDMLFSREEIMNDFVNYDILILEECEITVNEGIYHAGTGSVIRFAGRKPLR